MNNRAIHSELIHDGATAPERRAGLGLKLAALVGIGSAALAGCASQTAELAPPPSSTASESPAPTPEATAMPEQELTVEAMEIPATLSPEEAATILVEDRLSNWYMAGATKDIAAGYYSEGGSFSYVERIASANSRIFAEALFVPDWRSNEQLSDYVDWKREQNASALELWIKTSDSGYPQDREAYERSATFDSVTFNDLESGVAYLKVDATEHDNADRNRAGEELAPNIDPIDGNRISGDIELRQIDGTWKIASIAWTARE